MPKPSEPVKYVIVGGGVTAANAAESIRKADPAGSIVILGLEPHLPYDRPPLTKEYLQDDSMTPDSIVSRPADFYAKNSITVHTGTTVTKINRKEHTVQLKKGKPIEYDKLLLATGASPRRLDVPGKTFDGVKILRWVDESDSIRSALQSAKSIVLVGAGYIGMEVAASILKRGGDAKVTIVDPAHQPWQRFASPKLGGFLQQYFTARGVTFHLGCKVTELIGDGGMVTGVKTDAAGTIDADLVVVGVGVTLETGLAKDAGLKVDDKEGVVVDSFLQTSDKHIWAAGDIAFFDDIAMETKWHLEHYMNAMWQGEAVGAIMAGSETPFRHVPYFFSDMGDLHMVLRGNVREPGETRLLGDPAKNRFVELYPNKEGIVRMIVGVGEDQGEMEALAEKFEPIVLAKRQLEEIEAGEVGV